jgi:predicted nucleic acid-binding protein
MVLSADTDYLFDTTVFIDYLRGRPVAGSIFHQAQSMSLKIGYSILTLAELWVAVSTERQTRDYDLLLKPFQCYPIEIAVAKRAGELRAATGSVKGQSIPSVVDCLIAATGERYGLTVCSRNTRHFNLFRQYSISVVEYQL